VTAEAVIVDAVRTPIGRAIKGSLRAVRADDLAAVPLRALIERNPRVDFDQTADVVMGAASASGEQSYNVARNALLLAGIHHSVPGCTVNRFCASSLQALRIAPASAPRPTTRICTRSSTGRTARSATSTSRWAPPPKTSRSATASRGRTRTAGR
jgi:hypothetical protein